MTASRRLLSSFCVSRGPGCAGAFRLFGWRITSSLASSLGLKGEGSDWFKGAEITSSVGRQKKKRKWVWTTAAQE